MGDMSKKKCWELFLSFVKKILLKNIFSQIFFSWVNLFFAAKFFFFHIKTLFLHVIFFPENNKNNNNSNTLNLDMKK